MSWKPPPLPLLSRSTNRNNGDDSGGKGASLFPLLQRREERVTAMLCASQKTVALGIPLLKALLDDRPALLARVSAPLLLYHPLQLLVDSALAPALRRYAQNEG